MRAILISIHPQWVAKIFNGIKKDEIRKGTTIAINRLIEEQGVAPMLIYCTKKDSLGRIKDIPHDRYFVDCVDTPQDFEKMDSGYDGKGKVVARFNATAEHIEYETCSRNISGWWKDNGEMYDYKNACLTRKEMFDYIGAGEGTVIHINDLEIFDKPIDISELHIPSWAEVRYKTMREKEAKQYRLTCAPRSWCYVEI